MSLHATQFFHRGVFGRLMFAALAIAGTVATGNSAIAQERGNAARGEALALDTCIACHGVRRGQSSSDPLAPPFARIAEVPGMSEVALNVVLVSSHRAMPNLVLDARERADIVAYILGLRMN